MSDARSPSRAWLLYLLDIVAPLVAYVVMQALGAGAMWALSIAGVLAGATTLVNSVRRRALDPLGTLVLLELLVSVVLLAVTRDTKLLLIRPSLYTGVAAVYLVMSSLSSTPVSYVGTRPMAARGGSERLAAYERAWERSPEFRRTHRMVTAGFGVALAVDSVLRVLIVYRTPVERAAWLSSVPHTVAMVLMVACSALAGRRFSRLVDAEERSSPPPPVNPAASHRAANR
jgi:hypothetical protein